MQFIKRFRVGQRAIKTAISVGLALALAMVLGSSLPIFAAIGAISVMSRTWVDSLKESLNQIAGTFLGYLIACVFVTVLPNPTFFVWMALGVLCVISLCIGLKLNFAIPLASIVFADVCLYTGGDSIVYGFHRFTDTLVGLVVALLVTQFVAFPCSIIYGKLAGRFGSKTMITAAVVAYMCIVFFAAFFLRAALEFWILAILVGICIMGGGKQIVRITGVLVPFMGVFYILMAVAVMFLNIGRLPEVFVNIFSNAFDFKAIFGGFAGSAMMQGIKRGLYSNEAGVGSAPNAAAAANVSHPVKQGLVQMLSVFIDTILICTATAMMCLCTGIVPSEELKGAPFVQESLGTVFGVIGPYFITFALLLFAFTTLLGNLFYCEGCLNYIARRTLKNKEMNVFRLFAVVVVFIGAQLQFGLVWDLADVLMGIMAIINLPVIVILGNTALKCLDDYQAQKKEGKNPCFKAESIGLEGKTEFWN